MKSFQRPVLILGILIRRLRTQNSRILKEFPQGFVRSQLQRPPGGSGSREEEGRRKEEEGRNWGKREGREGKGKEERTREREEGVYRRRGEEERRRRAAGRGRRDEATVSHRASFERKESVSQFLEERMVAEPCLDT